MAASTEVLFQWALILLVSTLYVYQAGLWTKLTNLVQAKFSASKLEPVVTAKTSDQSEDKETDKGSYTELMETQFQSFKSLDACLHDMAQKVEDLTNLVLPLAAKRPHLDLIPEIKTAADLIKEDTESVKGKVEDGSILITKASKAEEKSTWATTLSGVQETQKSTMLIGDIVKEIKQHAQEIKRMSGGTQGFEALYNLVMTANQSLKNVGQGFPKIVTTEVGEVKQDLSTVKHELNALRDACQQRDDKLQEGMQQMLARQMSLREDFNKFDAMLKQVLAYQETVKDKAETCQETPAAPGRTDPGVRSQCAGSKYTNDYTNGWTWTCAIVADGSDTSRATNVSTLNGTFEPRSGMVSCNGNGY
ncbi:unnamed protein product, partial [Symbiodinium sp. CCMP2456]